MSNAFDLDQPVTAEMIPAMRAANVRAVVLYTRIATREIAELLSANDIDLVLVAEWSGGARYESYTAAQGLIDALRAENAAKAIGMPAGLGIYFCGADFDANAEQIAGGITDYLRAVKNGLTGSGIGVGVYGNGAVCQAMLDAGIAEKAFLWAGRATNGTQAFAQTGRASIMQEPTTSEFGVSIDPDQVVGESADYWGFRVPVTAVDPADPTETQDDPSSPTVWFSRPLFYTEPLMEGEDVKEAQRRLGVVVDGLYGRQTQAAVRAFQRTAGLPADGIIGPHTATALSAPA